MSLKEKFEKIKRSITGEPQDDEGGMVAEIVDVTTLSWSTRIKGFLICFVIGGILSILGSCLLFLGSLVTFAILYTFGNITAISSTCFLMGPINQLKRMFAATRIIAMTFVLVCLALTLCSALWWKIPALAILFCALQFVALTWYSLSYIPYARDAVMKCFSSCFSE